MSEDQQIATIIKASGRLAPAAQRQSTLWDSRPRLANPRAA